MIILIILIIVLLLSLSFINKTLKKKNVKLDNDNKLNENVIKRKQFLMYVEKGNGEYIEYSSSNIFPVGYVINLDKSICVDNAGEEVKGILSKNGNKLTITSNKTVFCYIYFDKQPITRYLIENVSNDVLWNSPLEGDGYRYVGTNPDNYICFGTTDKETCVNDTDKYMYRIIGIFEDKSGEQHAKLIKKEALNTIYAWHSDYSADIDWNESDLYKGINGSYFLTNEEYSYMQDAEWTDKISTWNYTMTNTKSLENYRNNSVYGPYYHYETGKTMYLHELNKNGKSNETCHYVSYTADCSAGEWTNLSTKISLMYASDYALSLGEEALNYDGENNYSTLKTGWMYLGNNDNSTLLNYEWTMSRLGMNETSYHSWTVLSSGYVHSFRTSANYEVRPVFYLESDIGLSINSGDGSITNPLIILE